MTTSPEALREGAFERLMLVADKPAHLLRWGEGDRNDLKAVLSALQEAREADVRVAAFLIEQQDEPSFWDTTNSGLHARVNYWRNKCIEAGRQLDPKRWVPTDAAEARALQAIANVVTNALNGLPPTRRGTLLRELMATAAAGLTALEGNAACAEAVYRLADAIVGDAPAQPPGAEP